MKKRIVVIIILVSFCMSSLLARSIYRPFDPLMPVISTRWEGDLKTHTLHRYHLQAYPLFKDFNDEYFQKHLLPQEPISYRDDPSQSIDPKKLTLQIEILLGEIAQGKQTFTHFKVLQSRDYNFTNAHGLLIVKFKDYPFVLKLFVETPESFVDPFNEGIVPVFCFFMSGGSNRHLLGFTRIKNREIIMQRVAKSPWKDEIDIPRKWYWVPPKARWIEFNGKFGKNEHHAKFPGTYCLIADFIEAERNLSLFDEDDKRIALQICNYLDNWIDPHMKNFMIEKRTRKFIIVDTEHFPTFTGLKEKVSFESYPQWYLYLAGKCWRNTFMQTKSERRNPPVPAAYMQLWHPAVS